MLIPVVLVLVASQPTRGCGLRYEFVEWPRLVSIAELTLSVLPATHEDVVSLTFNSVGNDVFGLGDEYLGSFDSSVFMLKTDGLCGLTSTAAGELTTRIIDDDPPASVFFTSERFEFGANITTPLDYLLLVGSDSEIRARGRWVAVPEPNGRCVLILLCCAGLLRYQISATG